MAESKKPVYTHEVVSRRDTGVHKPGQVVGQYQSLRRASRAVDKHDNNYGAYAYQARPIVQPVAAPEEPQTAIAPDVVAKPDGYGR